MQSISEENYIKAIYKLNRITLKGNYVTTNDIAKELNTKASSVTDMLKKLHQKKIIDYIKYKGVQLTPKGNKIALNIIRKHRLWEYFLVEKLNFNWDEVHDIAEELEHINSEELINRLDDFLDHPKHDPHGDPIPDKEGNIVHHKDTTLKDLKKNESGIIVGVKEHSKAFLNFLDINNLGLGKKIKVLNINTFDNSMEITYNDMIKTFSNQVCKNILIKK
ncbi:MAG: metal-dependent transcriptional regulator [Vicingaceae bacterium]